jgi:EAL domain-containing protein (putative c-di-GMP-specific phosphodiesterase class I)
VCFEITETAAIGNFARATRFIHAVRRRQCKFVLDDFGSGLCSFTYLKSLPVDYLKIDCVFVKDVAQDPLDFAMVRSINEIGQLLGMRTVAEFVESDAILEKLADIGIDAAQGYLFGRPEPLIRI